MNFFDRKRAFKGKFDKEITEHRANIYSQSKDNNALNEQDLSGLLSFIDQDKKSILMMNDKRLTQDLIAEKVKSEEN